MMRKKKDEGGKKSLKARKNCRKFFTDKTFHLCNGRAIQSQKRPHIMRATQKIERK